MPRKATGQFVRGPGGISFRYWKTRRGPDGAPELDDDGNPIKERVTEPLNTHNELLAQQRAEALLRADAEGRTASMAETFKDAAARIQAIRLKTIPNAKDEIIWVRNHVTPALGRMLARDVQTEDIMAVLERMRDEKYTDQSIRHVRNAVHAIFKKLKAEGVVKASPAPAIEDLPEALPETVDERPKAVLSDEELFVYLDYADPREGEMYRRPVRERQLMTLLSRCVGGMRTGEIQGLTWARARAAGGAFDGIEVIRYKTRRKAAKRGSKAVARQLYPLGDTVLPFFLRYWYLRQAHVGGVEPDHESPLFPVARERRAGEGRVGQKREGKHSLARALRRDVKRAFGLEVWNEEAGAKHGAGRWVAAENPDANARRMAELLEGTEDRRPLWFHNSRNMAAIAAERVERLNRAAQTTGHATGKMLQHYREMAGEVDVVPVLPEFLPDADRLVLILRDWCRLDGIDVRDVFGPDFEWPTGKGGAKRRSGRNTPKTPETANAPFPSVSQDYSGISDPSGLLSRRPEVRILAGTPLKQGISAQAANPDVPDKGGAKRRRAPQQPEADGKDGALLSVLPPGPLTAADIRKALDRAIVDGDVHLARRLNQLAAELEQQSAAPGKERRR